MVYRHLVFACGLIRYCPVVQSFEQLSQAAQGVTLEEANGLCRSLLSFASHYGREDELAEEARQQPDMWTQGPPTRATSIVACVPMHVDASGQSIGLPLHHLVLLCLYMDQTAHLQEACGGSRPGSSWRVNKLHNSSLMQVRTDLQYQE